MTRVTAKTLESMAGVKHQQAAAKLLLKNEARWIVVNIVKLPELLRNSFCSFVAIIHVNFSTSMNI